MSEGSRRAQGEQSRSQTESLFKDTPSPSCPAGSSPSGGPWGTVLPLLCRNWERCLAKPLRSQASRVCGRVASGHQKRQDSPCILTAPGLVPDRTTRDAKIRNKTRADRKHSKEQPQACATAALLPAGCALRHSQPWVSKSQRPCHISFQANGPSRTCDSQLNAASAWVSEGDPPWGPCVGAMPSPHSLCSLGSWWVECQALGLDPEFRYQPHSCPQAW